MLDTKKFHNQPRDLDQARRKSSPSIKKDKPKNKDKDKDAAVAKIKAWWIKGLGKLKLPIKKHRTTKLNDFHLLSTLGSGRFARVRLVLAKERPVGPSQFALKYFAKERVASARQVDLVLLERDFLSRLAPYRHPFLINLHASFQDIERTYLLLDVGENGDLRKFMSRDISSPLFPSLLRVWMAQLTSALAFIHGMGIVHRDVKPDNLVIDGLGNIRLTDFNVSTALNEGRLTGRAGSLAYMAPEVVRGDVYAACVDWWSVGVLFFELVHGQRPFRSKLPANSPKYREQVENAILNEQPTFLSDGPEWLGLGGLLEQLLSKDPSFRPGDRTLAKHVYFIPLLGCNFEWQRLLKGEVRSPFSRIILETERKVRFEPSSRLSQGFQVIDSRTRSFIHTKSTNFSPLVFEIPPIPRMTFQDMPTFPHVRKKGSLQPNELANLFREPQAPPPLELHKSNSSHDPAELFSPISIAPASPSFIRELDALATRFSDFDIRNHYSCRSSQRLIEIQEISFPNLRKNSVM